ncbi:hypothetical protein Tco_1394561 [Tanacetum coccineum]
MRETCVDLQSQGNYTLFRETMALPVQNINHSAFRSMFEKEKLSGNNFNDWFARLKLVLRVEKKMHVIEQPLPPAPEAGAEPNIVAQWTALYDAHTEIACLMLGNGLSKTSCTLGWLGVSSRKPVTLNPSPPFGLLFISPLKGFSGLSVCAREREILGDSAVCEDFGNCFSISCCDYVFICYVVRSMALCSIGVVYVVRSMALCSIGGVYVVRSMALCSIGGVLSYAFSDSLLLTPLCCDDIHDVTPRVSALAGCDRLVSEPLVIENILVMFSPTRKKSRWGTIFPTGLERYKEPLVEPKEIGYPCSSLISLNRGSFDVIVGMDWLSKRKFVIVCHEKVVRIPLEGDEILRVHGERTQGVVKTLVNTKSNVKDKILATPSETSKVENAPAEMLRDLDQQMEKRADDDVFERMAMDQLVLEYRGMILAAQSEAFKQENALAERLHGLDQQMERKEDESLYFMDRI